MDDIQERIRKLRDEGALPWVIKAEIDKYLQEKQAQKKSELQSDIMASQSPGNIQTEPYNLGPDITKDRFLQSLSETTPPTGSKISINPEDALRELMDSYDKRKSIYSEQGAIIGPTQRAGRIGPPGFDSPSILEQALQAIGKAGQTAGEIIPSIRNQAIKAGASELTGQIVPGIFPKSQPEKAKEIVPSQRLAPEPSTPLERVSEETALGISEKEKPLSTEQKEKVNEYVRSKYLDQQRANATRVQRAFAHKQFSLGNANFQNLILAAGQAIGGAPAPKVGAEAADVGVQAALARQGDLEREESIDPNSERSRNTQEFIKANLSEEIVKKLPRLDQMSHAELVQLLPGLEKFADMAWKKSAAEDTTEMKRIREGRLSLDAEKRITDIDNVLGELGELEKSANDPSLGPVTGRWVKFKSKLGMTNSKEATLLSNINFHTMALLRSMGGVRGAASPELHKIMQGLTPEAMNNPEAFMAIVNAVRQQMINDRMNTLKVQAAQGRENVINLLPKGYTTKKNESGGYDIIPENGMEEATKAVGEPSKTIIITWPEDGSTRKILDTPEARAAAKQAGYQVPEE